MRNARLLALAAVVYIVAAWSVAPGFYDGIAPSQPYNFVCPPAQAGANSPPSSGHLTIKVINGSSDPNVAFTDDGQALALFLPGAFNVEGKASITVDITPVNPCPKPPGLTFVTNTYHVSADAPLTKSASIELRYSNLLLNPSYIYRADSPDGPWTNIGSTSQAQPYVIETKTDRFGYFAAGYPSNAVSKQPGASGNQLLPLVVALLILAVLIGGIPLAVVRRRQAARDEDDGEDDEVQSRNSRQYVQRADSGVSG